MNLNLTKLVEELELSVPGFKEFLDAVSAVKHYICGIKILRSKETDKLVFVNFCGLDVHVIQPQIIKSDEMFDNFSYFLFKYILWHPSRIASIEAILIGYHII
ncbi:MAG: hypothetical protein AB2693_32750 [Candidatus Thiodiazotropha sp.]